MRLATDENRFTYEELVAHGISPKSVKVRLNQSAKGWLCEIDKRTVGFVIADTKDAEIWIIAVLTEYINRGIGSRLLQMAEEWLISKGHKRLWLSTDPDKRLRAYSFYIKHGWSEWKTENGILYMEKLIE